MRGRAWRREQTARLHARLLRRIRRDGRGSYSFNWRLQSGIGLEYQRRNSVDEMILVVARTEPEIEEYWRLRASREMNNRQPCDCMWCHGARARGLGNSAKVLTLKETSALSEGTADIGLATEDHRPINFTWKRRKARPSFY